jgi:hypothetical protein
MAITTSGNIVDTITTDGDYWVGNTAQGSLTVDGGSILTVQSPSAATGNQEARFWVGRTAGVLQSTVNISGAGSMIDVVSAGNLTAGNVGATINIGRDGHGAVNLTSGATLRLRDPVGTGFTPSDGSGTEFMMVGRGAGANGTLSVNASTVDITGTAGALHIGRDGGTGNANFSNGSVLNIAATIAAAEANINIGRGGIGNLTFDASTANLTAGGAANTATLFYTAFINIGRDMGGNGTLRLQNNSTMTLKGDSALPGTPGADTGVNVGRTGGTGFLEVLSGSDLLLTDSPQGANFNVGRVQGGTSPSNGTATISGAGSTVTLDTTGFAFAGVGRSATATGTINVTNGGLFTLDGDTGARMELGARDFQVTTGNGGIGMLNVNTGGTVVINSNSATNDASILAGLYGGNANIEIVGGTLRLESLTRSFINLGFTYDNTGTGTIASGSQGTAYMTVGAGGLLELRDGTGTNRLHIGGGVGEGGLLIENGGRVNLDAGDSGLGQAYVGVGSGSAGTLPTQSGNLYVTGASSELVGVGRLNIGQNPFETNNTGGNGFVSVSNGGRIQADNGVVVGSGGHLFGNGGSIDTPNGAYVAVRDGGTLGDGGSEFNSMDINGSLSLVRGGKLLFDISAANQDGYDVTGSTTVFAPTGGSLYFGRTNITFNVIGGHQFTANEERGIFYTTGATIYNTTNNDSQNAWDSTFTINGQHADFAYYFGTLANSTNWGFRALNSGATGGNAVLDFGATSTVAALYDYSFDDDKAQVSGGVFGTSGGFANFAETIRGTAAGDDLSAETSDFDVTLEGRGGDDFLLGGLGADTLDGGDNDDILEGGAGDDAMDGGDGDDIIVYDAADTAANVKGGSGTDTLGVLNIPAPTSFNLAAQGFERAEVILYDASEVYSWSLITDIYNASWAIQTRTVENDDNSRDFLRYDQPGSSATWSIISENYNAQNQLATSSVILDDQSYNKSTYDLSGATWSLIFDSFNSLNQKTSSTTIFDDQSYNKSTYDLSGAAWSLIFDSFNSLNQKTDSTIIFDDQTYNKSTFDLSGAAWSLIFDDYNSANQKTASTIIFDDQTYNKSTFDLSGAAWSLIFDNYNSSNQKTASTVIFDDQTYNKTTYDLTGATWSYVFDNYTSSNQLATSTVIMDDNSFNITTYDLNNANWSNFVDYYNTAGQRTRQFGTFDNGQTWEYFY